MVFLMGLNDVYDTVRGQVLLNDPLPPIAKVFSLILQKEKQRAIGATNSVSTHNQVAFAVKSAPVKSSGDPTKPKSTKKDRPLYAHCGLLGHTENRCYKLHGYPLGHPKSQGKPAVSQVNQVFVEDSTQNPSPTLNLTPLQYQQLMQLLRTQPMPSMAPSIANVLAGMDFTSYHNNLNLNEDSWIVDSGASSHVTHSPNFFVETQPLLNHFVTLPNQTKIRALSIDTIILSSSLVLQCTIHTSVSC